ncbi:MAG: hydroxysqualene dehydroxylase HpnE [Methylophilaceae bacterium]
MKSSTHVGIIGGGVAGLAAAAKLAEKGIETTIFEAGSQLGGRARNVAVEFNSQVTQLDNGQHILVGAYQQTLKLLELAGINEKKAFMRLPLTLDIKSLNHQSSFKLSTPRYLPFPINQLFGFLFCKGLILKDRFSVIKFMLNIKQSGYRLSTDIPLKEYLTQKKQSESVIALLWEPLCLAALNTPLHLASSRVFLNILKDTFSHKKSNSDFLLPKLGLSQLFAQPISRYILEKHGHVLTNHRVSDVKASEKGFRIKSKNKNKTFEFSHVIVAIASKRLKNIVAGLPALSNITAITEHYRYQPIYSVYLQYPSHIKLASPMIGLSGTISQWVFDRGILCGQQGLLAVVISAEGKHQKLTHDALALKVAHELHQVFPILGKPLWHQVIAEKRATFSCEVNLARPANKTRQPNLFIAGDYTYQDYPSTIEGAVRSGIKAANMVIN